MFRPSVRTAPSQKQDSWRAALALRAGVFRMATVVAWAEMRAVYSPLSWGVGWLGRIVAQVLFFAVIGLLLEDPEAVRRLFVGQAVLACAMEVMLAVQSTTWERNTGSVPLLVAAPAPLWPVFAGRSVQWIPSGLATSSVVLFGCGQLVGLSWSPMIVLGVLAGLVAVSLGTYGLGLVLGALVLRARNWRNIVANVATGIMGAFAGVSVPVSFWPVGVQMAVQILPITHGLAFIRSVLAQQPDGGALWWAVVTGLGWWAAAGLAFGLFGESGRSDGSIAFDD